MILSPSRAVRVFAYPAPVDLRKGYDGLYGLVEAGLKQDPMSGDLFLFVNESRKLCKVLVWDGSGLCIFQKRLAKGSFAKLWRDDDQGPSPHAERALVVHRGIDHPRSPLAFPDRCSAKTCCFGSRSVI